MCSMGKWPPLKHFIFIIFSEMDAFFHLFNYFFHWFRYLFWTRCEPVRCAWTLPFSLQACTGAERDVIEIAWRHRNVLWRASLYSCFSTLRTPRTTHLSTTRSTTKPVVTRDQSSCKDFTAHQSSHRSRPKDITWSVASANRWRRTISSCQASQGLAVQIKESSRTEDAVNRHTIHDNLTSAGSVPISTPFSLTYMHSPRCEKNLGHVLGETGSRIQLQTVWITQCIHFLPLYNRFRKKHLLIKNLRFENGLLMYFWLK